MKLAAYTYLADGKVGRIDFGNGVRTGYGFDERGMIQIVDHYRPGIQDLSWRQYWRDNRDRITAFQKSYNPGSNPMENGRGDRFAYDDEGELTDGWYNAIDPAGNATSWTRKDHFSYDELGNRQGDSNNLASRNSGQNATSFVRRDNGLNQYTHWWPAGRDFAISHDDNSPFTGYTSSPGNGVLMADGWLVASYNALNQPVAMIPYSWSDAIYFGYDPLGRCVKRWTGGSSNVYSNPATYFHYDGWNLLQEGNNAWGPARVYVHGNRVDEIVWSYNTARGGEGFHQYDARGDCTLLTDRSGNILEQYEYDAFGQPYFYGASGNSIGAIDAHGLWAGYSLFGNRFLFTGREWLSDLKVYDYRNRMYQPELGRFLQPDPKQFAAGDYNLYRYCHNDPINKNDPMGLDAIWDRIMAWQSGRPGGISEQLTEKRVFAALDQAAGWAERHHKEVAGTMNSRGEVIEGPIEGRQLRGSDPGPITKDTRAIWHIHLMLKPNPYMFSTWPRGSDNISLMRHPTVSHYVGVLNAPPGQFTIFAQTPEMKYQHTVRLGPQPWPPPTEE
jgi:RHS repeat-associated protein